MAGGLLNIISNGNANVILTGNPSKTFFTASYAKYTNFGMQKFRVDYDGTRDLRLSESSSFQFKFPRNADLLMDAYLVVNLPHIWSPIHDPTAETNQKWVPYEFAWIKDIGTTLIQEVELTCGSHILAKYSGEYIAAMVERDFSAEKKDLFNKMTGNIPELYDPANAYGRKNTYPSAYYSTGSNGSEPSIRGRNLYIPINLFFSLTSFSAFPLVCLQYNELVLTLRLRPIRDLFKVRDVYDNTNNYPYIQPDFNLPQFNMYYFLQSPPGESISQSDFPIIDNIWNADVHLLTTYCFLSEDEKRQFTTKDQTYLVKDIFEYNFNNITGTQRLKTTSNGMVSSWMWYLQRNDVNMRNEWSNYTNWPYENIPVDVMPAPYNINVNFGPGINPDRSNTGIYFTGDFNEMNQKEILQTAGILLNGQYRELNMDVGVFNYVEKYVRTQGFAKEGLYCYNFCLNTSPFEYQPSGAINMSKFRNIELEITTYTPPIDNVNSQFTVVYDSTGFPISTSNPNWKKYEYNYNAKIFEERYNVLSIIGGNCGMMYAR